MQKNYTKEFKLKAVHEVIKENKKVKDVAEELKVPIGNLYKWLNIYKQSGEFYGKGHAKSENKKILRNLEIENQILKKALFLPNKTEVIFEFIYEHKKIFPVQTMCRLLKVSSSGYYKFANSTESLEELRYKQIVKLVKDIYLKHGPDIGSPRITEIINHNEPITSQATVARILKNHKEEWHASNSRFHKDEDVVLHFHNKNTYFDMNAGKYYHQEFAKQKIESLLDSTYLHDFHKHKNRDSYSVDGFTLNDNLAIQGENLIILHKLKQYFRRKIKLIYIDPPYNTERSDLSYHDNYSRSDYLLFLKNRLEVAKDLLKISGSIFIHCSNKEQGYLKVLCDEIFGEENFVNQIVWRKTYGQQNTSQMATTKDFILIYAKNKKYLQLNRSNISASQLKSYKYTDQHGRFRIDRIQNKRNGYYHYQVKAPNGEYIESRWDYPKATFENLLNNNLVYWSNGNVPSKKVYLNEEPSKVVNDLWTSKEYGSTQKATIELKSVIGENDFTYPKPEKLIKKIIELASLENDIMLDFFAGSGTTAAAASKLNRQWISVELNKDNYDLIIKRLQKSITDSQSFISCQLK
ncbi:DNA methyltransferase [Virgibacillus alimentarius]|uniref:DNA methyltransferase n=1 Tax=Virgibacillus alimentarius TaxID=698769 RepID=UPI00049320C0|nr:DNA methyltransferase [Virgibacillus alimentarius]